jgi:hypothetical protein
MSLLTELKKIRGTVTIDMALLTELEKHSVERLKT